MIVINLTDIIIISIIILIIVIIVIIVISITTIIIEEIKKIGKKNCYDCKNYQLYDVCSCGDGCRYKCIKNNRIDSIVSLNCNVHYEKCKGSDSDE